MFRTVGAVLLTLGSIFLVMGMWGTKENSWFVLQLLTGPVFIYYGLQLLK